MSKKKNALVYLCCVIIGALGGFKFINLQPSKVDTPAIDVKVDVPKPVVIRDTIIKKEVKYKYVYKKICCCDSCIKDITK